MSRELIFSDKTIRDLLTSFVPVALNTYGLQHENRTTDSAAKEFFFKVADQANLYEGVPKRYLGKPRFPYHPTKSPEGTPQGFYVCSSEGELQFATWGLIANYGPGELLTKLKKVQPANKKMDSKSTEAVVDGKSVAPENVAIINVYAKMGMLDPKAEMPEGVMDRGRDLLWITNDELNELAKGSFPNTLRTRISLFHLVDTTPGVPTGWDPDDVNQATFHAKPVKSEKGIRVEISGKFDIAKDDKTAGYEGTLNGEILIKDSKLVDLRLVADGEAWYPNTEDRWPPKGRFSMKIGFVRSTNPVDRQVLPVVAMFGDTYEAYLVYEIPE